MTTTCDFTPASASQCCYVRPLSSANSRSPRITWNVQTGNNNYTLTAPPGELPNYGNICAGKIVHVVDPTGSHQNDSTRVESGVLQGRNHCVLGKNRQNPTWECAQNAEYVDYLTNVHAREMGARDYYKWTNPVSDAIWNVTHQGVYDHWTFRTTDTYHEDENVLVAESVAQCNDGEIYKLDTSNNVNQGIKAWLRPKGTCCTDRSWTDGHGGDCSAYPCMYLTNSFELNNRFNNSFDRIAQPAHIAGSRLKELEQMVTDTGIATESNHAHCNAINTHQNGWYQSNDQRGVFHKLHCTNDNESSCDP